MTHAMVKGSNIQLGASAVRAVLQWSPAPGIPGIDVSALLLGANGRVRSDQDFVFYNQPSHPSGLVRHRPKQHAAEGTMDTVEVELGSLDASVDCVLVAASVDSGSFGQVADLRILVYDLAAGQNADPMAEYRVVPDTGRETALNCGELYRRGDGWKFRAVGQGYTTGLVGLVTAFGITVDDGSPQMPQGPGRGQAPEPVGGPAGTSSPQPAAAAGTGPGASSPPSTPPPPPHPPSQQGGYGFPQPQPSQAPHVPQQGGYGYPPPQPSQAPGGYGYPPPQPSQPGGYGYPPPHPGQAPQPPQPGGYGYPQPGGGYGYPQQPPPTTQPQAGYGYPPPQPGGHPSHQHPQTQPQGQQPPPGQAPGPNGVHNQNAAQDGKSFTLPPQGPQFQPGRSARR